METKTHTIDAAGRSLGRVASEVAYCLRGKRNPGFLPHLIPNEHVCVINVDKVRAHGKKMRESIHARYSGYPGGLKKATWEEVSNKKGQAELMRHAIAGMLPKNKLRKQILKNLTIAL